ncbi:hypothetical protein EVAR_10377_1 [Eumeta japonica]|uniref:Uncharacterized protein n=1 Tax=Eumeta variegata TaxID=151549 RepID=A0A4C1UCD7_EUMVA|nr:hypothetical protein EVAR_10377_1 [Eumeta japonica]
MSSVNTPSLKSVPFFVEEFHMRGNQRRCTVSSFTVNRAMISSAVFQGLPNEDFGEFYENYETLAALKNWTERQRKAGLTVYTAGPAKLFLKTIDATAMTYDEIIKEFNEEFKCRAFCFI